jgi:steroid delta-isomerase
MNVPIPTRAQAADIVQRYAAAMTAGDADALAALFAAEATRQDPIGSLVNHGRPEIRAAFASVLPADGAVRRFVPGPVRGTGRSIAFAFDYSSTSDGTTSTLAGIDVFTLTDDLLIQDAVAYWGPDDQ